ncbi:MAG: transposase, partial [Alcaligenaceae bacterium]|nr:transposase [Alcaligenaceae bacterium]NLA88559.1 transposase [Alcaligenaceae bacterium]
VLADWIGFYNHQRPHQSLGMKSPVEVREALAA